MKLKEPWRFSDWVFYYQTLDTPPLEGRVAGSSEPDLLAKVRKQLSALRIPIPDDLPEIVQHQICMRQKDPKSVCWNSGAGDALHHDWVKPFLQRTAEAVVTATKTSRVMKKIGAKIGERLKKIAACTSCGGTTIYIPSQNNRGRAGSINDFLK
jgi:hypothetical protein